VSTPRYIFISRSPVFHPPSRSHSDQSFSSSPDWLKLAEEQKQKRVSAALVPTVDAFADASPLVHLPDELLFRIFDYLSEPELGRTAQVRNHIYNYRER
jgi:hypothetical protein